MIRSMTAFASAEGACDLGALSCELRTVNHRYLEPSLRLPEELRPFEPVLRERIAARLARGKIDVGFRLRGDAGSQGLEINEDVVGRLASLHGELHRRFPNARVETTELLRFPGVLRQPELDRDALQTAVLSVLTQALDGLTTSREREGARLADMMRERLDGMEEQLAVLRQMMPEIRQALRQRLETRLADLAQPVDPGRLEQELVLQVTRADVDEELDRLDTHVAEARRVLGLDEPVGRRLDFLMQEFNREANTLGSKAVDTRSTQAAVELKVLIEQMREQVQNIE